MSRISGCRVSRPTLNPPLPTAISGFSSPLQEYIIHVRRPDNLLGSDKTSLENYYLSFLPTTTAAAAADPSSSRLLYSYTTAITGFAARLTAEEVRSMSSKPGFLGGYPSPTYRLMTTHSPSFLRLKSGLRPQSNQGEGVIIGMLDTERDQSDGEADDVEV